MKQIVYQDVVEVDAELGDRARQRAMTALNLHHVSAENTNIPDPEPGGYFIADPEIEKHPNYPKLEASHYMLSSQRVKLQRTVYDDGTMSFEVLEAT